MKKYFSLLSVLAIGILATGCSMGDAYNENANKEASDAAFVKEFGDIASNQTWNTVTQRTAIVNVSLGTGESYTVGIYENDPLFNVSNCGLLAQGTVSDGSSVSLKFDSPAEQTKYYIGLFDSKGRSIAKLDSLNNNVLNTTFGGTVSASKAMTRVSADNNNTSTAYNTYVRTASDFSIPEFTSSYYDISKMSSSSSSTITVDETEYLAANNYSESFKYGDGKHYYIPTGATIKANVGYSKGKDSNCVIYVQGTWEVPSDIAFDNGEQIVVAKGGKIIFDGDAAFNSSARFINQGTIITNSGDIKIENYSSTTAEIYNSGTMTLNDGGLSIAGNSENVYSSGTMTMNYLNARGNCTVTNYGTLTAKTTTKGDLTLAGQNTAASNFKLVNGCHTSIDAMGVVRLIVIDNTRVDCSTGIYTGGGQDDNYVCLGNHAEVNAGDWMDNGGHIYGSKTSGEESLFKFSGTVSESNCGAFITKGYVYFDGTFSTDYHVNAIKTGDGSIYSKGSCTYHIQYFSTETSSLIIIPSGDCTGTGYNAKGGGGDIPTTAPACTFAFEDLGSIGDFDFNDIVLYVYPNTTTKKMDVELVAAGGVLPVTVKFNGTTLFSKTDGQMRNTSSKGSVIATYNDLPFPDDNFTLSSNTYTSMFTIDVKGASSTYTISPNVTAGSTPQALVIAGAWAWPKETVNIGKAYTTFSDWVANPTVTWVTSKVSGQVVE